VRPNPVDRPYCSRIAGKVNFVLPLERAAENGRAAGAPMAEFSIEEQEGLRFVRVRLVDDSVRIEAGALANLHGRITMDASIPSIGTMVSATLSEERAIRPMLTGTGDVILESSTGGFHILAVKDEEWILEAGAYWASDNEIKVGTYRERMLNSFFAGDGFIDFCTRISGRGKVVLTARGPVHEVTLGEGEVYAAESRGVVIARTRGIDYRLKRPTRSLLGYWLAGEHLLRVFTGPGRVLVAPQAYWGAFLLERFGRRPEIAHADRPRPAVNDPMHP
jgi:uncharacterized protein (AIM24 family)